MWEGRGGEVGVGGPGEWGGVITTYRVAAGCCGGVAHPRGWLRGSTAACTEVIYLGN